LSPPLRPGSFGLPNNAAPSSPIARQPHESLYSKLESQTSPTTILNLNRP
jgi:hypothetical protein